MVPAPKASASLIVPFEDLKTALETVPKLKLSSLNPQAIEFMEREIVLASERHTGRSTFPREMEGQPVGAYLLITLDSDSEDQLYTLLEQAAELVLDAGAMDVLVADSPAKMRDAWAARSAFLEVIMEETKLLDECDVVVPVTKIASYLEFVNKTGSGYGLAGKRSSCKSFPAWLVRPICCLPPDQTGSNPEGECSHLFYRTSGR